MVKALVVGDPKWVGPYLISGRLGAGGMGQVYLGHSPGGRAVAVKVIRPELADDPDFRKRFAREAAAAQAVSGAFTAAVVGADPDGEPPWLATLHVPGLSLSGAVARHGPLPEPSVSALGAGLAEALQAIHVAGLVHRDLKPSNVLLAADGPRVIDFGIAVASSGAGAAGTITYAGTVAGTPGFMAPEQLTGGPVGAAADVFCLGAVLVFAACGQGPFGPGPAPALSYRVVHEPSDLEAVPPRLRPLVAWCLAKDPAARPAVPGLLRALAELAVPGGAASAERRGTVAPALRSEDWLPTPVADAVGRAVTVTAAATPSVPDAVEEGGAPPFSAGGQFGGPPSPPPAPGAPASGPTRRGVLAGFLGAAAVSATGFGGWALLHGRGDGGAQRAGSGGGTSRLAWKVTTGGPVTAAMVAAGGVVYAGSKDGNLYALDTATGKQRWQFATGNGVYSAAAVSGAVAYAGSADYGLYAVRVATGREKWRFDADDEVNSSPVVAGGMVYVGSDDRSLYAVDARTGEKRWKFTTGGWVRSSPVVAGGTVYVGSKDRHLYALDAATGELRWKFTTGDEVKSSPVLWGRVVCVGSYDGSVYAVDARTGEKRWEFATDGGVGSSPALAGGAVHVGSDDGRLYAVDLETGKQRWRFRVGDVVYSSPAVAGGVVYVGAKNGVLYAVDAETGEKRWRYATGADVKSSPAVASGLVFIGNDDGVVHALRA